MYRVQWGVYVETVIGGRFQDIIGTQVKLCSKHTAPNGSVPNASLEFYLVLINRIFYVLAKFFEENYKVLF